MTALALVPAVFGGACGRGDAEHSGSTQTSLAPAAGGSTGTVSVGGTVNICAKIDGIGASPDKALVGGRMAFSVATHDDVPGPGPLQYQWSATSGAFDNPASPNPQFICAIANPVTVTLTLSDGDAGCQDTRSMTVICDPFDPDAAKAWRESMANTPLPSIGCFNASYPSTVWQATPCITPAQNPMLPVGGGNDFVASTSPTGLISKAVGSFDSVMGVTSIFSPPPGVGPFSLQLNSNKFPTAACMGQSGCLGWEQFVVDMGPNLSTLVPSVYIQIWLVGFQGLCPPGWFTSPGRGCYRNSDGTPIPLLYLFSQSLNQILSSVILIGRTGATTDTLIFSTTGGDLNAVGAENIVNLQPNWQEAEFNLFGDSNASNAVFNNNTFDTLSTIVVRTAIDDGTTNAPSCSPLPPPVVPGFTAETNSLTLLPNCCPVSVPEPAIVFTESDVPGATSSCTGTSCTTPGLSVLSDTILSAGSNCNSTMTFPAGGACHPGYVFDSCTATAVDDNPASFSTCTVTSISGCGCSVTAASANNCNSNGNHGVNCHVLVTEKPIAGSLARIVANGTGHNGSDCGTTHWDHTFTPKCDPGFKLGTCSARLISDPNGSACSARPTSNIAPDCGCILTVTTPPGPLGCSDSATCSLVATEIPITGWDANCSSLNRF
jgi:hypothetical protein